MDFINVEANPVNIWLPFDLSDYVELYPGNMVLLAGGKSCGKGHPCGTKILGKYGWENIEHLKVGDEIYASDGTLTKITGLYDRGLQQCFEFVFNDKTRITTDFEHLWNIKSPYERYDKKTGRGNKNGKYGEYKTLEAYKVLSMVGGFGKIRSRNSYLKYIIPKNKPIQYETKDVDIDPYILGVLLGDGCLCKGTISFSTSDVDELVGAMKDKVNIGAIRKDNRSNCYHVSILKFGDLIKKYGLWDKRSYEKFIPTEYIFNDEKIRLAVLQGLCDTDGDVSKNGRTITITTTSKQMSEDALFIIRSLGGKASIISRRTTYTHNGEKKRGRLSYRITMASEFCPFRLKRKKDRWKPKARNYNKAITEINDAGIQKTICISIDHPSGLYVAQDFIVTHNTGIMLNLIHENMREWDVEYFNSEMGTAELRRRLDLFPYTAINNWNFTAYKRASNFGEAIVGGTNKLILIDFLEIHDEFYAVGKAIKSIHDNLKGAIAVVALQKNPGSDVGLGGWRSAEVSRLYLSIDRGRVKITDAKNFKQPDKNPNGWIRHFNIKSGCQITTPEGWKREPKD